MDRGVELSVAGAAEAAPIVVAGPDRRWGGAVVAGEGVSRSESFDAGDFADQFR